MVPRIFIALAAALAVNVVLIFVTVAGRENGDDEPTQPPQSQVANGAIETGAIPETDSAPVTNATLAAQTNPNAMLEVPSLPAGDLPSEFDDLEALGRADPAFMEAATQLYPGLKQQLRGSRHVPTTAYFSALEQRLKTVRQLTLAAEQLSRDATRVVSTDPELSERHLQMITQLREMASNLLVEEVQ